MQQKLKKSNQDILVKKSRIHGRGVFVKRTFHKDELVVHWDGAKLLTKKQVGRLPKRELTYVSSFDRGKFILHHPPARYINHSCAPNTHIDRRWMGDRATRTIRKGEEITSDYGFEIAFGQDVLCRCGHQNCRRTLKI